VERKYLALKLQCEVHQQHYTALSDFLAQHAGWVARTVWKVRRAGAWWRNLWA
jgi:phage-related protein